MKLFTSRPAIALAAAAAFSMTASPAMARGWYRHHHRGVDAGDVFAGMVIIGGIAAIAAAASKSNRDKREREREYRDRYPDRDYRDQRDQRDYRDYRGSRNYGERPGGYAGGPRSDPYPGSGGPGWQAGSSTDTAVDRCVNEVERGDRQVDTVESVSRESDGWRVDGRISGNGDYSCVISHEGQVRRVTVDGRAVI